MPYVIEDHYLAGIPQTALLGGLVSRGIAEHWTAGGVGRQGARDTAQFFIDRADRNASYHEIPWWEQGTRTFGVLRIVRSERAAHSMNPTPPDWSPNAEVRRILGDRVGDPNACSYAVSFAGMPADLAVAMRDPYFIECYARRAKELLAQEAISIERPLFNHGWGQPTTRSDAGPDLIPAIYARLGGDALPALKPVRQQWTTGTGDTLATSTTAAPGGQFWTLGPDAGERKFFTAAERVWSNAETADTFFREVEYGSEVIWMHRNNLRPIAGTRNPATGFGAPVLTTGFTQAQLDAAKAASFADAKTKAKVAVDGIKA